MKHLLEIEVDKKLRDFYQFLKTSKSKEEVLQLGEWLLEDMQFIQH